MEDLNDENAREQFIKLLYELNGEIIEAISAPEMEPARILRLAAMGVGYCLLSTAMLLEDQNK